MSPKRKRTIIIVAVVLLLIALLGVGIWIGVSLNNQPDDPNPNSGGVYLEPNQGGKCEHTYDNACDTVCNECGEERKIAHAWQNADRDTPKTCTVCGTTEGEALGHEWTTPDVGLCQVQSTDGTRLEDCSAAQQPALTRWFVTPQYGEFDSDNHIDENTDHICDHACGKTDIGTHADVATDTDHLCDYGCGATLEACSGGTATCTEKAVCSICNVPYGGTDANAHAYGAASYTWSDDYNTCTAERSCSRSSVHIEREKKDSAYANGKATATFTNTAFSAQTVDLTGAAQMTADKLKAAVAYMLSKGETDITIMMAETPDAEMFTAIRRALLDTEGVKDGSINLTLGGG